MKSFTNKELVHAINEISFDCHKLCRLVLGKYLPVAGNMGVFCHSDEEYEVLTKIREELTEPSNNPDQKYFRLYESIVVPASKDIPEAVYTHLYIRKPDPSPYGKYLGDVDFVLEPNEYLALKGSVSQGKINGAEIYDRPGWDTFQITDPSMNSIAFVSTKEFSEKVRVKF